MNKTLKYISIALLFIALIGFVACTDDNDNDNLYPEVMADFTYELDHDNLTADFTNISTGAATYHWDFGDGNSSNEVNASHQYANPGDYTVTLTATNTVGTSNVTSYSITIEDTTVYCDVETTGNDLDPANAPLNITFRDGDNPMEAFGGINIAVVENPVLDDVNSSCNVFQYVRTTGAETWGGTAVAGGLTSSIVPETQPSHIQVKVLSATRTANVTVRLEFLPYPDTEPSVNVVVPTTVVGEWETLDFDFSEHTDKTFQSMVIYIDEGVAGDDAVFYMDDIQQVEGGCSNESQPNQIDPANSPLYIGFQDGNSPFGAFGDMNGEVVENPVVSGINRSCNVYRYEKTAGAQVWAGTAVDGGLLSAIDPSTQPGHIKMKVLSETRTASITVRLEFLPYPDVDPAVNVVVPTTQIGVWEELDFDFSEHTDKTFQSMVIYVDEGAEGDDSVYYLDDIKQQ